MKTGMVGKTTHGFTLIELMVVISIISLLIALLLPALSKARSSARIVTCMANVRAIAQMSFVYSADNRDCIISAYPAGSSPYGATGQAHYQILQTAEYLGTSGLQTRFRCPDLINNDQTGLTPYFGYGYPINAFVSMVPGGFPGTPRALRNGQVKQPQKKVFYGDGMGTVNGVAGYVVYGDCVTAGRHNSTAPVVAGATAGTVLTDWDKRTANLTFLDGHGTFVYGDVINRKDNFSNSLFYQDNLYINAQGGNYP